MTSPLPAPLHDEQVAALAAVTGSANPVPGPDPARTRLTRARLTRACRHPVRTAAGLARRTRRPLLNRVARVLELDQLPAQMRGVEAVASSAHDRAATAAADTLSQTAALSEQIDRTRINLELLKGEFRNLLHTVEELGMALAPGSGLAGAGIRVAELREAVNSLERRLRNTAPPVHHPHAAGIESAAAQPASALFNYVGFERRFRGDPERIVATLDERYGELLSRHEPVVDIGCGRGELLERLAGRGVDVIGVDTDPGMVAEGRARGLKIEQASAGDFLRNADDRSLGSIISTHVVEHLALDALIEMLELAVGKLRPGGVFIAETPNPSSLIVLGNSYILDPTHVWPLHPSLLSFLAESAGFRDVRLRFFAPAEDYHLRPVQIGPGSGDDGLQLRSVADQVTAQFDRLNNVLFGPQEYSIIATAPGTAD